MHERVVVHGLGACARVHVQAHGYRRAPVYTYALAYEIAFKLKCTRTYTCTCWYKLTHMCRCARALACVAAGFLGCITLLTLVFF